MKILLASDVYRYTMNGAAGVVMTLADTMRADGHEVKVLTMSTTNSAFRQGDDYYLPSFSSPLYPDVRQTMIRNHPYIDEIKRWRPDIIHLHTEGSAARFARAIARSTGTPLVMTMHTDYAKYALHQFSAARFFRPSLLVLAAYFYRGATVATTPSEKAKDLLRSYNYKKPIYVVPNGIKQDRFRKDFLPEERRALFEQYKIEDNGKTFVCVSRLSAEKNIKELLNHFSALVKKDSEVHLLLVGDGPYMNSLIRHTERRGLSNHVTFTGRIPQEELYRYYKAGIAFLSASTFEMHSLTYLEAAVCGLPLICRDDPCLKGVLLHGENGFAFQEEKDFVESCLQLIADKELQKKMSEASLEISERYSDKNCARQMVKLYQRVAQQD